MQLCSQRYADVFAGNFVNFNRLWCSEIQLQFEDAGFRKVASGARKQVHTVVLPSVGLVRQTIHFALPIFLNCIL